MKSSEVLKNRLGQLKRRIRDLKAKEEAAITSHSDLIALQKKTIDEIEGKGFHERSAILKTATIEEKRLMKLIADAPKIICSTKIQEAEEERLNLEHDIKILERMGR